MLAHTDARSLRERRFTGSTPTCNNGIEVTMVPGSGNTETETVESFYDSQCQTLEAVLVWDITETGYDLSGPVTLTQYSTTGAVIGTASGQVALTYSSSDQLTGVSILYTTITEQSTPVGSSGIACSGVSSTTCSVAVIANANSGEVGALADVALSPTVANSIAMQISTFAGAAGALSIASGTFPDWIITPAPDQTSSVSITGSSSATGEFTLTLTDATNGATVAVTEASSGSVTGTVTATGSSTALATFTINTSGNGTLTYGNGSQVTILDYIVQS